MAYRSSFLRAFVEFAAGGMAQRALWTGVILATIVAIGGGPVRRRLGMAVPAIVAVAAAAFAQPALATFTATNAPVSTLQAASIAAPSGLGCSWSTGSSAALSWTATATSWADNNYVNRSTNGGAASEVGNTGNRTTVTYTDTGLTPESNAYTWTVKAGKNNWRGAATSSLAATSCTGGATVSTVSKPVVTARVASPEAVAVDSSGNIFIADTANHCIREVLASTGIIGVVAGLCGTSGVPGNGVAATGSTARLNSPAAIAIDGSNNIYVADTGNNQVRKFTVGGTITAFAGTGTGSFSGDTGAATSATLNQPAGVAVSSSGNVFISDRSNHRIREVLASNANIYTIAGDGTGADNGVGTAGQAATHRVKNPSQLAIDASNNVFIADKSNNKIREITCDSPCTATPPTFTMLEIAGTGTAGFSGDGGAAGSAKLSAPVGVTVDSSENVYIADTGTGYIRKVTAVSGVIDSTKTISTVAGTGTSAYNGDGYPALSTNLNTPSGVFVAAGMVYLADTNHHMIRMITSNNNVIAVAGMGTTGSTDNTLAASAGLVKPQGVAVDSSGNVYIADAGDNRIRKWFYGTNETAVIAGDGAAGSGGGSGDGSAAIAAKISAPEGVAVASNGDVYIADTGHNRIRVIDHTTGVINNYAGNSGGSACATPPCGDGGAATSGRLKAPSDLVLDSSGNLFIADTDDHAIRKVDTSATPQLSTFAGTQLTSGSTDSPSKFNAPDGLGIDGSDNIYVADTANNLIRKITPAAAVSTIMGTAAQNTLCAGTALTGVTLASPGDVVVVGTTIYVADTGHHRICRVASGTSANFMGDGNSGTTGDAGVPGSARIESPGGLAYSATYGLFVSHAVTNGRVRRVTAPLYVS